jgi:hypothetical protein
MALMGIARSREYRPLPFRVHLLSLVIGIVLPALIVAALLVRRVVNDNRAAVDRQLVEAARAEAAMVDGELRGTVLALEGLARCSGSKRFASCATSRCGTRSSYCGLTDSR